MSSVGKRSAAMGLLLIATLAGCRQPETSPYRTISTALQNADHEPVRIAIVGDSRSLVDHTISPSAEVSSTFGNRWSDLLRIALQARYGSHGTGVTPVFWALGKYRLLPNSDYWRPSAPLGQDCSLGPHAPGGTYCFFAAISPGSSISFDPHGIAFDHLRAICEKTSTSGDLAVSMDRSPFVPICTGTSDTPTVFVGVSKAVELRSHAVLFLCTGNTPCLLGAADGVAGTTGVSVDNYSVGGAALGAFASDPATQFAVADAIPEGYRLVIETHHTNEPGIGETPKQFRDELSTLIAHFRDSASIEIVALPQNDLKDNDQTPYYDVLHSVAEKLRVGFVDARAGMGFDPSIFSPDGIHENNAGHRKDFEAISSPMSHGR